MDAAILKSAPLFSELSDDERHTIAPYAAEVRVSEGKCLVAQGDYSYDLLVIEEGEAEVTQGERHVADVGKGDVIGEMGVLGNQTRNATVTAKTPMTLITLSRWDIRRLRKNHAQLVERLEAVAEQRSKS
jgi:CRP/FNR family transcriptional regulator, cyclic AMP receptor protein